jgi:hypothetical protein
MLEILKRILDRLSNFDLSSWLNSITISGYKVGLDTAQKDLKEEYPSEPDMEAIVRIGMRAHALSEKAIARAKGGMAHGADKLYQEMDAAMKAGMSEKEALFQIQGRLKGLFSDSYKTAADSKRMEGQITEIDKPYTDPLTGEKYMLAHIRPNDRCFSVGLWELPEDTIERDGLVYAKNSESDFIKGGAGSGIKGHKTEKKLPKQLLLPDGVADILYKYEYMEKLNEYQLERFRKQILDKVKDAKKKYTRVAGYFPGDTEFERLHRKLVVDLGKLENKLESALSVGEKKIAIDAVFHLAHVHGRYAIFEGTGEGIKRALDYIRDQRVHKDIGAFDFLKGGIGSGIKGHRTAKKEKSKLYKAVEDFETKYRKRKMENGLLLDKKGNILLAKKGRKDKISYTREEELKFFLSKKGHLFTHNHPNDATFSKSDFTTHWVAGLKETRAVGSTNTFILRTIKEIPKEVYYDMVASFQTHHNHFFYKYTQKVQEEKMDAYDATIAYADEAMEAFVKEFPEYLHYQKITNIEKGGPGSGIKGHKTWKEKTVAHKIIKDFEDVIREQPIEHGMLIDKSGEIVLVKKGDNHSIHFTGTEYDKAKTFKDLIFTHNHPTGNPFSCEDVFMAAAWGFREERAVGKEYTYIIKIEKNFPFQYLEGSYTEIYNSRYDYYSSRVWDGKMTAHEASMKHKHETWTDLAELLSGFEYERIKNRG